MWVFTHTDTMSFRTFYEIKYVNAKGKQKITAESYTKENGMIICKHYPNINHITNKILRIDPSTKHIPIEKIVDINEREIRF